MRVISHYLGATYILFCFGFSILCNIKMDIIEWVCIISSYMYYWFLITATTWNSFQKITRNIPQNHRVCFSLNSCKGWGVRFTWNCALAARYWRLLTSHGQTGYDPVTRGVHRKECPGIHSNPHEGHSIYSFLSVLLFISYKTNNKKK